MNFIIMLLAPMLWASAFLTEKVLLGGTGEDSKPGALMAFSGLSNLVFGLLIIGPILVINSRAIPLVAFFMLMANGLGFIVAMFLFLEALRIEEVSRVDPWFQTIPAFGLVLAFVFLGETIAWYQLLAIALLSIGSCFLKSRGTARWKAVGLMIAASILLAINDVWFARYGRGLGTAQAIFPDVMGKAFWGLILLVGRKTREGFLLGLRTKLKLQSTSDALSILADFIFDRAKLYSPVAIVQAVGCTQPLFTLLGATLLTRFYPHILSEVQGGAFWKKSLGILIVIAGGAIIGMTS